MQAIEGKPEPEKIEQANKPIRSLKDALDYEYIIPLDKLIEMYEKKRSG